MWSERHRPQDISDMVGNEEARAAVIQWIAKWKKGTKPLLLVGPAGIGKTTIANIISRQFNYDMIGLNASDVRSKSQINEILSPVLGNRSILGNPLIFVDEVDGIHGRSDYGGADALVRILKEATVPIILAANHDDTQKMQNIKKTVKTVMFRPVPPRLLYVYVRDVLAREGASLGPGTFFRLVNQCRGDIRSILNSAQAQVSGFDPPTEKSFQALNVEEGINAFFKAQSVQEAWMVLFVLRVDPREKIRAFYSSIMSSRMQPGDMARALETLSRADVLYGRIMRTQNWRLLRYLDSILLNLYRPDSGLRYSQYYLPWQALNRIRWDGAKIKALCGMLGRMLHASRSTVVTFYLPLVLVCIKNNALHLDINESFDDILEKETKMLS